MTGTAAGQTLPVMMLCARQELALAVRSRWTQVFALVFATLAIAVATSGYVLSGGYGVQDFARTAASLVQLVLLLVPLAALVMGVLALFPERGGAELLFAQPATRASILLGRMLGLLAALTAAQAIGFAASGVVIFWHAGGADAGAFVTVFAFSVVLTAVFLGVAALLSAAAPGRRRARTLALALVVWFAAAVLFDVAALAVASLLPSGIATRVLVAAVVANPVDAVRTGALLAVEGSTAFGAASLAFVRITARFGGPAVLLAASLLVWLTVPVALAARRLARADL